MARPSAQSERAHSGKTPSSQTRVGGMRLRPCNIASPASYRWRRFPHDISLLGLRLAECTRCRAVALVGICPRQTESLLCDVSIPGASTERRVACPFLVLVLSRACPELYVVSAALLVCSVRPVQPGPSLALLPQRCPCPCPRPSSSAPFLRRSVMVRVSLRSIIAPLKLSSVLL